jgi:cytochrome c biogenesis protein CcmG, thiol:disulfide interchange protein DsbE
MRRSLAPTLLILLALLAACAPQGERRQGVRIGEPLPDAQFTTGAGDRVRVADLEGSPAVLNFWATWCGPCREEIPVLQAAHADNQEVVFLAITDELATTVRPFMNRIDMTLPVWYDPGGRAGKLYGIQSIPTTIFLDATGNVVARHVGALSRPLLDDYLERIRAEAQPATPAPTGAPAPAPSAPPAPRPEGGDSVGWIPQRPRL